MLVDRSSVSVRRWLNQASMVATCSVLVDRRSVSVDRGRGLNQTGVVSSWMYMRRSRMDVRGSGVHVWSRGVHMRGSVCWRLLGSFEDSRTLVWDTGGVSVSLNVGIDRDKTRGTSTFDNITEASGTDSILWMVLFASHNGVSVIASMRVAVAFWLLDEGLAQIRVATALHDFFAIDVVLVDLIVIVVVGVVVFRSHQLVAIIVLVLL